MLQTPLISGEKSGEFYEQMTEAYKGQVDGVIGVLNYPGFVEK